MMRRSDNTPAAPGKRLGVRLGLAGAVVLLLVAGAAFYFASRQAHHARQDDAAVVVHVHGDRCEPNALTVPAGRTTFRIVNDSRRAVEWEILDGVMVIEERENIAPGFSQTLSANLVPGRYAMTCGLLSNPRGALTVTATEASDAARSARPKLVTFIGALAEYRVYLSAHADALVSDTNSLVKAVAAQDMAAARQAYQSAYAHYASIEPAAGSFGDLATRMDGQAAYFERREIDPEFRGFRRLDALVSQAQPSADLARLAHELAADAQALRERLMAQTLPPDRMAAGAARTVHQLAGTNLSGLSAETARMRAQAALAGARKVFSLLKPFVERRDASLSASIEQGFDRVTQAPWGVPSSSNGTTASAAHTDETKAPDAAAWQSLADQLQRVEAALGYA